MILKKYKKLNTSNFDEQQLLDKSQDEQKKN